MSFNVNPVAWKGIILSAAGKVVDKTLQDWQRQVADFCAQVQSFLTPLGLSSILNGNASLLGSSFATKVVDLGTITTDQTVNVAGAQFVSIRLASGINQTRVLTLNNLPSGASVMLDVNSAASSLTLKMAATNPTGTVYTIQSWLNTTAAQADMVATGAVLGVLRYMFLGMTGVIGSTPNLNLMWI